MPRYHFNLHDTHLTIDEEGYDLPNLNVARCMAADFLGSTIKDAGLDLFAPSGWRMEVTDARGLILFTVEVHAHDAPAVTSVQKAYHAAG